MDGLMFLLMLAGLWYWAYKSGKRIGSHKGYHVGRRRGRRR